MRDSLAGGDFLSPQDPTLTTLWSCLVANEGPRCVHVNMTAPSCACHPINSSSSPTLPYEGTNVNAEKKLILQACLLSFLNFHLALGTIFFLSTKKFLG
jgi:hypothetical protein